MKTDEKPEIWRVEMEDYDRDLIEMEMTKAWSGITRYNDPQQSIKPYAIVIGLSLCDTDLYGLFMSNKTMFVLEIFVFKNVLWLQDWLDSFGEEKCLEVNYGTL